MFASPGRVYLAGPDVFLPDATTRAARMKEICRAHGLEGVFPLDPAPEGVDASAESWRRIALVNEAHIRRCDALIANLTPFRGVSADAGTVFELGYARGLGRPVFGWSAAGDCLATRVRSGAVTGAPTETDRVLIEDFGLAENLMIPAAIAHSGGVLVARTLARKWDDLSLFTHCVAQAAAALAGEPAAQRPA